MCVVLISTKQQAKPWDVLGVQDILSLPWQGAAYVHKSAFLGLLITKSEQISELGMHEETDHAELLKIHHTTRILSFFLLR